MINEPERHWMCRSCAKVAQSYRPPEEWISIKKRDSEMPGGWHMLGIYCNIDCMLDMFCEPEEEE